MDQGDNPHRETGALLTQELLPSTGVQAGGTGSFWDTVT